MWAIRKKGIRNMNRTVVCIGIFSLAILGASARADEKSHHNAEVIPKANAGVAQELLKAQSDPMKSEALIERNRLSH